MKEEQIVLDYIDKVNMLRCYEVYVRISDKHSLHDLIIFVEKNDCEIIFRDGIPYAQIFAIAKPLYNYNM